MSWSAVFLFFLCFFLFLFPRVLSPVGLTPPFVVAVLLSFRHLPVLAPSPFPPPPPPPPPPLSLSSGLCHRYLRRRRNAIDLGVLGCYANTDPWLVAYAPQWLSNNAQPVTPSTGVHAPKRLGLGGSYSAASLRMAWTPPQVLARARHVEASSEHPHVRPEVVWGGSGKTARGIGSGIGSGSGSVFDRHRPPPHTRFFRKPSRTEFLVEPARKVSATMVLLHATSPAHSHSRSLSRSRSHSVAPSTARLLSAHTTGTGTGATPPAGPVSARADAATGSSEFGTGGVLGMPPPQPLPQPSTAVAAATATAPATSASGARVSAAGGVAPSHAAVLQRMDTTASIDTTGGRTTYGPPALHVETSSGGGGVDGGVGLGLGLGLGLGVGVGGNTRATATGGGGVTGGGGGGGGGCRGSTSCTVVDGVVQEYGIAVPPVLSTPANSPLHVGTPSVASRSTTIDTSHSSHSSSSRRRRSAGPRTSRRPPRAMSASRARASGGGGSAAHREGGPFQHIVQAYNAAVASHGSGGGGSGSGSGATSHRGSGRGGSGRGGSITTATARTRSHRSTTAHHHHHHHSHGHSHSHGRTHARNASAHAGKGGGVSTVAPASGGSPGIVSARRHTQSGHRRPQDYFAHTQAWNAATYQV